MIEKKILTDTNFTKLPFFSASKNNKLTEKTTKSLIYNNNDGSKTTLNISYNGNRKPTFFDRRVLAVIEHAFVLKYGNSLESINKDIKDKYNSFLLDYLKENNVNENKLTPAENQLCIYKAARSITSNYTIDLDLSSLSTLMDSTKSKGQKTNIKKAIEILGSTNMLMNTSWEVGGYDKNLIENDIPLITYIVTKLDGNRKRELYSIYLNPLHFYNIVNGQYTYLDLNLLNSFKSNIAGRLYEFIKPKLYKPNSSKRDKITLTYDTIVSQLLLVKHNTEALIKRQLKPSLDELISKGVIYEYQIVKGLLEYEIDFSNNLDFFENYINQLSKKDKYNLMEYFLELTDEDKQEYQNKADLYFKRNENFKRIPKRKKDIVMENYVLYTIAESGVII